MLTTYQVHRQVDHRLREHFSPPQLAQPVRASSSRGARRDSVDDDKVRRMKTEPM